MKALILNSGLGSRMGVLTSEHPKCMTKISDNDTILSRQLKLLYKAGIKDVVITTGYFDAVLEDYCNSLDLSMNISYVKNPLYAETNYIYSIYCAKKELEDEDILLMHGDIVFEYSVLERMLKNEYSCMKVSSTLDLPCKDFKAVVKNGRVQAVGVEFFDSAMEAQAFYKFNKKDWNIWLKRIVDFCEKGDTNCYAEKALNEITGDLSLEAYDVKHSLCTEIDNMEDLAIVKSKIKELENRTVYMCFSTDMMHSGHISIIKKAQELGKLIIGVLSDEAIASYKRFPILPYSERMSKREKKNKEKNEKKKKQKKKKVA